MKTQRQFLLLALSLLFSAGIFAQNNAMFLKVKAAKQGDIKGDVTEKGKEGQIRVTAYAHEIVSPRDVASGMATGKRQHKPFVITKEIDKASPLLYNALSSNEMLPEVTLSFYRPAKAGSGASAQWYTIRLSNAIISGIKSWTDDKGQPFEDVSLVYQRIAWTYTDGNVTFEDNANTQGKQ